MDTTANGQFKWYVAQARSNTEKSVVNSIIERVKRFGLSDQFGEIIAPTEEVVEMKAGQKRQVSRKLFPGYVLVQIKGEVDGNHHLISNEAWHLVKETPNISGFIGGTADRPNPIGDDEAERILSRVRIAAEKPAPKNMFERGQNVRVKEGPFADFNGVVEATDYEKSKVSVAVLVFGRATIVDFDINQIESTD